MARRYGRIQGLVLSLGSPSFYRNVARNWGGIGLLYVLLLLTLTWIPILVQWQLAFRNFALVEFPKVAKDFPKIGLKNGKVSSSVPQPYVWTDPKTGQVVFVMDTTGKIKNLDQTEAQFLLTETKLYVRNQAETRIIDLSQFPNDLEISKEIIQGWLVTGSNWLGVVLFPFAMICSLIRALILMLLAGLLGMIFNSAYDARLSYGTLVRLSAVGLTLSVYLDTGLGLADIHVPFWFLITLALTTFYVAFGAKASKQGMPEGPDSFDDHYGRNDSFDDYGRRDIDPWSEGIRE